MKEKLMQELIIHFPSEILEEPGLSYLQREIITGNNRLEKVLLDRRIDMFWSKCNRDLLIQNKGVKSALDSLTF